MQGVWQYIKNLFVSAGVVAIALVIFNLVAHDLLQMVYRDYGDIALVFLIAILLITAIPRKKW